MYNVCVYACVRIYVCVCICMCDLQLLPLPSRQGHSVGRHGGYLTPVGLEGNNDVIMISARLRVWHHSHQLLLPPKAHVHCQNHWTGNHPHHWHRKWMSNEYTLHLALSWPHTGINIISCYSRVQTLPLPSPHIQAPQFTATLSCVTFFLGAAIPCETQLTQSDTQ